MKWVTATKIAQWADTRDCENLLPELLRMLIVASSKKSAQVSFPGGDSIYKPSWDGKCSSKDEYGFIPKGTSFWEFGRGKDFKKKCNSDYNKRTQQTQQSTRRKSTFVFVTPRRWDQTPLKDKWIESKANKKEWSRVIVYDADDIENWLEQNPAVGAWFAKELKLATGDVESAYDYWNRFVDNLKLTADLIISGRNNEKDEILRFFAGGYGVKEIQASSEPEAICLTIASVISQGPVAKADFFSRSIVVSSKESLKTLAAIHENQNLIFNSKHDEVIDSTEARLNYIINPVSFNVGTVGTRVSLPKSESFIKSLEAIGYSFEKAIKLSKESGRSFSVLKRILSETPGRVSWNEGNNILELLPVFQVQKFDENKIGDRQLIEQFSNEVYNSYKDKLKRWSLIFDRPVVQVGNHWRVVSPYDLLHVLGRRISEHHLVHFEEIFMKVFNETDPALELEPKMRYAAAIFNKESPYSTRVKEGLCQTLLTLAVYGESSGISVNFNIQHWADRIVGKLLSNKDANFWFSIQNKLHLIAEASPLAFLGALERMIKEEPKQIASMFSDKDFDLFSPSYYTHILWALEALAWDPNSLLRVTLVLSDLAKLDKGIKTANKPINSLRHIFLLWLPQTFAPLEARNQVIEELIKRNPDTAFSLLKVIAPKVHDNGHYNYKPIFRQREYVTEKVTQAQWQGGISFVRKKLSELALNSCDRWSQIIDLIDDFQGNERNQMIVSLTSTVELSGDVNRLRDELRNFISKHETYSKQAWALSHGELEPLIKFFDRLIVNDVDRYYWYFNVDTIGRYGESGDNYEKQLIKSDIKRSEAIKIIFNSLGVNGVLELALRVERPWSVGYHLGEAIDNLDLDILPFLSKEDKIASMAMGYVASASKKRHIDWIESQIAVLAENHSPEIMTNFFLACEPSSAIWDLLKSTSSDANGLYWKKANFHSGFFKNNIPDLVRCIENLNDHKRFVASTNLIMLRKEEVPSQIIVDTLEGLTVYQEANQKLEFGSWGIHELFLHLDQRGLDENKMASLEWKYLPLLNDSPHNRPPKYLFKALEDPKFFSEILSWIYRPDNKNELGNEDLDNKTIFYRARNADELLNSWEKLPGESAEHEIDLQVLMPWVQAVIQECEQTDRKNKSYYAIGKLIGIAHERSNKWPQLEICKIIEDLNNDNLNEGFVTGSINGSRVKAGLRPAGSNSERQHFEHFKSLSLSLTNRFPIVARLLLEVGKHYEAWAQHSDLRDEQMDIDV